MLPDKIFPEKINLQRKMCIHKLKEWKQCYQKMKLI